MPTKSEVIKMLNKNLRGSLTTSEWGFLEDQGRVQDMLSQHGDDLREEVDVVTGLIKSIRHRFPSRGQPAGSSAPEHMVPPSGRTTASVGERNAAYALALSENVAAEADQDSSVTAFRDQHLTDSLICLDQVEEWIARHCREQSTERRIARVAVPEGWDYGDPLPSDHAALQTDQLAYVAPGYATVRNVMVAPSGVLWRLHRLATGLAIAHGWEPSQAATWVLTGVTPLIGLIRITEGQENIRENRWTAWSERITLDVHPAATPEEVTAAYRDARKRLDTRRTGGDHRARSQSVPQLVLARFVARKRAHPAPTPWSELRVAWNNWVKTQSDRSGLKLYDFDSQFQRAARLACRRVLFRGYYIGNGAAAMAAAEDA